jgi:Flp pilus assembly protein TadG
MKRFLTGWLKDRRGVAAVEFAFIAPLMIALYFGLAELTIGLMAERRASHLASTMADLVAQEASMTHTGIDEVLTAGAAIMQPFPSGTNDLKVRLTSVVADPEGVPKVAWSRSQGAGYAPLAVGSTVTGLPANLLGANEGLIMGEVVYYHTPIVGYVIDETMQFSEKFYLRPRQGTVVACNGC